MSALEINPTFGFDNSGCSFPKKLLHTNNLQYPNGSNSNWDSATAILSILNNQMVSKFRWIHADMANHAIVKISFLVYKSCFISHCSFVASFAQKDLFAMDQQDLEHSGALLAFAGAASVIGSCS